MTRPAIFDCASGHRRTVAGPDPAHQALSLEAQRSLQRSGLSHRPLFSIEEGVRHSGVPSATLRVARQLIALFPLLMSRHERRVKRAESKAFRDAIEDSVPCHLDVSGLIIIQRINETGH